MQDPAEEYRGLADELGRLAADRGLTLGAVESLTSGAIANALGAATDASTWFRGGIVAYAEGVKRELLGVTAPRLASAECAAELAVAARRLLGADLAVSVTGVGGPSPSEGEPPGTVYAAVAASDGIRASAHRVFDGDPAEVVHRTVGLALELLRDAAAPPPAA